MILFNNTMIQEQEQGQQAYRYFLDSLATNATKITYTFNLRQYCKHLNCTNLSDLLAKEPKYIEAQIIDYIVSLRERGLSYSRLNSSLSAITHFYTMNDVTINRRKISKFMGERRKKGIARSEQGCSTPASSQRA